MKFPEQLVVVVEDEGKTDEFLSIRGSLQDVDEDGQTTAIYRLEKVGHVGISHAFFEKKGKKRSTK